MASSPALPRGLDSRRALHRRAVVLSPIPVWPVRGGYSIAIHSDVAALAQLGYKITVLAFSPASVATVQCPLADVDLRILPWAPGGRAWRFLRSLVRGLPAAWERYYTASATRAIDQFFGAYSPWGETMDLLLVEDLPLAAYARRLRRFGPAVVLRLHNVQQEIYTGMAQQARWLGRFAAFVEQHRVTAFERSTATSGIAVWCISDRDARLLARLYGCPMPSVLGVALDRPDLVSLDVRAGERGTLVHIGVVDLKKRPGVERLLEAIRLLRGSRHPDVKLVLAGEHTVRVAGLHAEGVEVCGAVADDAPVFARGRFFVNPQTVSGGIKLKSICALLAGRTLVSTPQGVEGLPLVPHWDFVPIDDPIDLVKVIPELMADEERALAIARRGRAAAVELTRASRVLAEIKELLGSLGQAT